MPVRIGDLGNVGANAAVAVRDQGLLLGSAEYVLLEALVSMLFRQIARVPKRPFLEDVMLHSISLPFVGGLGAPFGRAGNYREGYGKQVVDGARAVPAVFLAQYVVGTSQSGFHMPKVSIKDILITAAAKIITRPLTKLIFDFSPAVVKEHIERMRLLFARQETASTLLGLLMYTNEWPYDRPGRMDDPYRAPPPRVAGGFTGTRQRPVAVADGDP